MKKAAYIKHIKSQIKVDADYIPNFETTISILAELLEERDRVYKIYQEQGAQPTIIFESDRGAKNPKPNPLFKQWNDLNVTVLNYLDKLGLTAAGLRKLQGQLPKEEVKKDDFAELLDSSWDKGMSEEEKKFFDAEGALLDYEGWQAWLDKHDTE